MSFKTIEAEVVKKKSLTIPIIVGIVSLLAIAWIGDHFAGNCLKAEDVFTYCPID